MFQSLRVWSIAGVGGEDVEGFIENSLRRVGLSCREYMLLLLSLNYTYCRYRLVGGRG